MRQENTTFRFTSAVYVSPASLLPARILPADSTSSSRSGGFDLWYECLVMANRLCCAYKADQVIIAGAGFPVAAKKIPWLKIPPKVFFVCKHFGTGVLIATAFVHVSNICGITREDSFYLTRKSASSGGFREFDRPMSP